MTRLIEKLAHEYWLKQRDLSLTGDPETYNPDMTSFEAGFRAAREMAIESIEVSFSKEPKDTAYWKIQASNVDLIFMLGEFEVTEPGTTLMEE